MTSVVIVSWNTREMLRECLESLFAQTRTPVEVFVVDNHSSDGSAAMVRARFPHVRLIANDENLGFAAANNQALERTTGEQILLLNPDTVVLDAAIDRMVDYLVRHPEAGAVGCKLLNADGSLQPSCHEFYGFFRSLIENRLTAALYPRTHANTPFLSFWDHARPRQVGWVTGAALMVRASVLARVGPLDTRFFMYGEEVDWQLRMRKAGYQVHFTPEAQIVHLGGGSSRQIRARMKQQELHSRWLLIEKHYGPLTRLSYRAKAALALTFWRWLARRSGGAA